MTKPIGEVGPEVSEMGAAALAEEELTRSTLATALASERPALDLVLENIGARVRENALAALATTEELPRVLLVEVSSARGLAEVLKLASGRPTLMLIHPNAMLLDDGLESSLATESFLQTVLAEIHATSALLIDDALRTADPNALSGAELLASIMADLGDPVEGEPLSLHQKLTRSGTSATALGKHLREILDEMGRIDDIRAVSRELTDSLDDLTPLATRDEVATVVRSILAELDNPNPL